MYLHFNQFVSESVSSCDKVAGLSLFRVSKGQMGRTVQLYSVFIKSNINPASRREVGYQTVSLKKNVHHKCVEDFKQF